MTKNDNIDQDEILELDELEEQEEADQEETTDESEDHEEEVAGETDYKKEFVKERRKRFSAEAKLKGPSNSEDTETNKDGVVDPKIEERLDRAELRDLGVKNKKAQDFVRLQAKALDITFDEAMSEKFVQVQVQHYVDQEAADQAVQSTSTSSGRKANASRLIDKFNSGDTNFTKDQIKKMFAAAHKK